MLTAEVKLQWVERVTVVEPSPTKGHHVRSPVRLCCLNTTLGKPLARGLIPPYIERVLELKNHHDIDFS